MKCWACGGKREISKLSNPRIKEPCIYCLDRQVDAEVDQEIEDRHERDGADDGRG